MLTFYNRPRLAVATDDQEKKEEVTEEVKKEDSKDEPKKEAPKKTEEEQEMAEFNQDFELARAQKAQESQARKHVVLPPP